MVRELRLLFWNVQRKLAAREHIVVLCDELKPDVLLLAEAPEAVDEITDAVGNNSPGTVRLSTIQSRVEIFVLSKKYSLRPRFGESRAEGFVVQGAGIEPHLLVAVHLPSGLWQDEHGQVHAAGQLHDAVRSWENELDHQRTILIGDFNVDPFSPAMVSLLGLNAMMTRRRAARGRRIVQRDERPVFYNPMWNLLGDWEGPPGSFYWKQGQVLGYFWHMLDQVLVRGELAHGLSEARVITGDGRLLSNQGLPLRDISDHLPLFVRLNLKEIS